MYSNLAVDDTVRLGRAARIPFGCDLGQLRTAKIHEFWLCKGIGKHYSNVTR